MAEETHAAPGERCQCRIYAARHPGQLGPYLSGQAADVRARDRLLGRVAGRLRLWGTVVECERGWRGSHAYPERIYLHRGGDGPLVDGAGLAAALTAYGAPVERVACETLDQLVEALAREAAAA